MPKTKKSNTKKYTSEYTFLKSIISIKVDGKLVYKK